MLPGRAGRWRVLLFFLPQVSDHVPLVALFLLSKQNHKNQAEIFLIQRG